VEENELAVVMKVVVVWVAGEEGGGCSEGGISEPKPLVKWDVILV
jgi:hypothetical protein